jgi:HEAT repeat protein
MRSSRWFWATATLVVAVVLAFGLRADDKPPAKLDPKEMPVPSSPSEIEGKTFEEWKTELKHEDPSVREKAIRALVLFGHEASRVVPDLVVMVSTERDASPRLRAVIALTVLEIAEKDRPKVIEALNGRLEDIPYPEPQGIVKYHAALALTRFGDEAKAAIPGLVKAIGEPSSFDTRRVAIVALRKIARDHKNGPDARATNALLGRLAIDGAGKPIEPAMEVRIEAMIGLGVMGRPADKALFTKVETTLEAYKNSSNELLSIWAWYGLIAHEKTTEEKGLDGICKHAASRKVMTRVHTATALGTIGPKAKSHVGCLIKMLEDRDGEVFVAACTALASIGEPGEKARKALNDLAEAKDDADPKPDPVRKAIAKMTLEAINNYEKNKDKGDAKDGK